MGTLERTTHGLTFAVPWGRSPRVCMHEDRRCQVRKDQHRDDDDGILAHSQLSVPRTCLLPVDHSLLAVTRSRAHPVQYSDRQHGSPHHEIASSVLYCIVYLFFSGSLKCRSLNFLPDQRLCTPQPRVPFVVASQLARCRRFLPCILFLCSQER